MWGKRSQKWNQLSSGWGKRTPQAPDNVDDDDDNEGLDTQKEKRGTWNKMTPMWGKRDAKIDLASLADELEKRAQAGWSHLNGAWGKRSAAPGTWKNLKGAWGKREAPDQQQQQQEQHLMNSSPAGSAEHGKGPERPLASEDKE
ncbi:unnamed protein product [Notodromas monacha]|uniref:Uncharacterized protein n=1 Tax=Notodromas monacha TaxID=399045 RepID=A0A7R9GEF3_9CRUS|nr:unnamed protein product [Notodromas monacha]CAG0919570.1 unnamed protein product [Notodromas monacha]